jgi:predicted ester cyclase
LAVQTVCHRAGRVAEAAVCTRLRKTSTFTGENLRILPNGQIVPITGIAIHRFVDVKLAEHRVLADLLSLMPQLGAFRRRPVPE